jgi:hypothetical protein
MTYPATVGAPYFTLFKAGTPDTEIENIEQVIIFKGRRRPTDVISAGTATVSGRRPDLVPTLRIGDVIKVNLNWTIDALDPNYSFTYEFRVADYTIEYGVVAALDRWTLDLEDAFAYLGRVTLQPTTFASGTNVATAAETIANNAGLTQQNYGVTNAFTSAVTVTNDNALDVYQGLVNTEAAQVIAEGDNIRWFARNWWLENSDITPFSDDNTAGTYKYTGLRGASLAENYATKVVIRVRGGSEVVTGDGIFSYNLDTYSFDTQQASFAGEWFLGSLDVDLETPQILSVLMNGQDLGVIAPITPLDPYGVTIKFRGETSNNQIIGYQIYGNLDETRYDLYLQNAAFYSFLVLDDENLGKLDENKLGW